MTAATPLSDAQSSVLLISPTNPAIPVDFPPSWTSDRCVDWWQQFAAHFDALRLRLVTGADGGRVQRFDGDPPDPRIVRLSGRPDVQEAYADGLRRRHSATELGPDAAPAPLIVLTDQGPRMTIAAHHVALDGYARRLLRVYGERAVDQGFGALPPPDVVSFARHLERRAGSSHSERNTSFWIRQLAADDVADDEGPGAVEPRPPVPAAVRGGALDAQGMARLRTAAAEAGCTVSTLLCAAFVRLLRRADPAGGSRRTVVSVGVSNRRTPDDYAVVGQLATTVYVPVQPEQAAAPDLPRRLHGALVVSYAHSEYSLEQVIRSLGGRPLNRRGRGYAFNYSEGVPGGEPRFADQSEADGFGLVIPSRSVVLNAIAGDGALIWRLVHDASEVAFSDADVTAALGVLLDGAESG